MPQTSLSAPHLHFRFFSTGSHPVWTISLPLTQGSSFPTLFFNFSFQIYGMASFACENVLVNPTPKHLTEHLSYSYWFPSYHIYPLVLCSFLWTGRQWKFFRAYHFIPTSHLRFPVAVPDSEKWQRWGQLQRHLLFRDQVEQATGNWPTCFPFPLFNIYPPHRNSPKPLTHVWENVV